jgi:hypothetical protein
MRVTVGFVDSFDRLFLECCSIGFEIWVVVISGLALRQGHPRILACVRRSEDRIRRGWVEECSFASRL